MHVQQIQRLGFEDFDHLCGEGKGVGRMVEQRIRRDFDFMKMDVGICQIHTNRRRITDEVNVVPARGKLLAKLGGHDAGAAVGGVASDTDAHWPGEALLRIEP